MSDFSLVPVDHQPDFDNVSLVPVDHDPFGDSDTIQQAPVQLAQTQTQPAQPEPQGQPQQPTTGADHPEATAGHRGVREWSDSASTPAR
jgi:hypothetical protein